MTNPRHEMQSVVKRIAFASVPHLPRELQAEWLASKISRESGKPVSSGTVRRWWDAQSDDPGSVDSRHMDWARARSRTMSANDNGFRAGRPCSAEAVRIAA